MATKNNLSQYDADFFKARLKHVSGKNLTQIADDMNLSKDNLSKKISNEKGKGHLSVDDLMLIAEKYNCSIDYLLGLGESIRISNNDLTSFTEIIKVFSSLFDKGVLKISSDSEIEFCNDVFPFLLNRIKQKKLAVAAGYDTDEDFDLWLKGLCRNFDYLFPNHKHLQDMEKEFEKMKQIFDFDDSAKLIKSYSDWQADCKKHGVTFKNDTESYSAYADDVFSFVDSKGNRISAATNSNDKDISYVWGMMKSADKKNLEDAGNK